MTRALDATFLAEKNKDKNFPVTLYELQLNASTTVYLTELDEDIEFDGNTYLQFPIKRGAISQNSEGQMDQLTIGVGNVSLEMSGFIASNDLRDNLFRIIMIFFDTKDTSTAKLEADFYIRSYVINELQVDFLVGSKLEIFDLSIPRRNFGRNICPFNYVTDGSGECKYAGAASPPDGDTCDKGLETPNGCRAHENVVNFGGFPGIPLPSKLIFA